MKQLRKALLLLPALLVLALSFAACGGDDGARTEAYLKILQSGAYHLTAEGDFDGNYYLVDEAVKDGNFAVFFRNANDSTYRFLCRDGVMYRYLTEPAIYAEAPDYAATDALFRNMTGYDYDSARYVKSGKQTVLGETYDYDVYTLKTVDGEEATLRLYLTAGHKNLYAIAFPDEAIAITVSQFSAAVPDTFFFEFPEHYQEVDYMQVESQPEF